MEKGLMQEDTVPREWTDMVEPHVESVNYFLTEGLAAVVAGLKPVDIVHPVTKHSYRFWLSNPVISRPVKEDAAATMDNRLFPWECRETGSTYKGPFSITINWARADHSAQGSFVKKLGGLPIMTRTRMCHLNGMTRQELVAVKEESGEMGGYFVCNGIERMIRSLIMQRRHYIMALRRSAYRKRGANYTECATLIRCVRADQSSATVRCHYLTDGTVNFAFTMQRSEFFIPAGVLLKCFLEVSDRELFDKIVAAAAPGSGHAAFVAERAELLLGQSQRLGLQTRSQCLDYLGTHFGVVLGLARNLPPHTVAAILLDEYVFIHLDHKRPADKLNLLLQMLHKLYAVTNSACCEDNADALTHHEILMPGHMMCKFMKEKLQDCLDIMKTLIKKDLGIDNLGMSSYHADEKRAGAAGINLEDEVYLKKVAEKIPDVGRKMEYLLNTGNLVSKSGLDLSQATGFTVVAEKLNWFRYLAHFRSVHRGAYFAQIRTTTVRKLLPESWGFMCPVHTPDGSPCGLLSHLTANARVVTRDVPDPGTTELAIMQVLTVQGMVPSAPALTPPGPPAHLTVMLDGKVVGSVLAPQAAMLISRLRLVKAALLALEQGTPAWQQQKGLDVQRLAAGLSDHELQLPSHMEVVHIPFLLGGVYPGIFIYTQAARLVRPVRQTSTMALELVGTLEQSNLPIRCPDGGIGGSPSLHFSHEELTATAMLSVVASMTPFSDYNQSPRNMYQCQMSKQTMGTAAQAAQFRTDTKLYRLQNPQTPLARTSRYDQYHMDEYPSGTNAVVAVLAYTGYDMEDAMILNKSSVDRGAFHACLYKTEKVDLRKVKGQRQVFSAEPLDPRAKDQHTFQPMEGAFGQRFPQNVPSEPDSEAVTRLHVNPRIAHKDYDHLGPDGLPYPGSIIWPKQAVYCVRDVTTGRFRSHALKGEEVAIVDQVTVVGTKEKGVMQHANIRLRINRNPAIGDKFASRAGQKGVLSIQWPDVNFPYCASTGMRPDLIINPHAFPSRMTIGMLLESMGSKAGALTGEFVDASPFQASDGKPGNPAHHFGKALESMGYAKHGQETMVSGITGEEMPCDIYVGLVYYQRLRHMVSDKFQVRSTGPINNLTHQPIKGRKFGGGIRFGEMERDSLLAHGAAYLLHDRLHACSDYHVLDVCTKCGSLLAPLTRPHAASSALGAHGLVSHAPGDLGRVVCPLCDDSSKHIERVAMPYVFKFLATELAAMNIKVSLDTK